MTHTSEYGAFILRLALGAMYLAHGLLKVFVFTLPGTAGFFAAQGFPAWTAYVVVAAELLAGIALIVGFQVRLVALAGLPILFGALAVHLPNGWVFSAANGGWEYPGFLIVASIVQALIGAGAYAFSPAWTGLRPLQA
ncbi:MAG: DoxX family protein [Pseudorhodoplanes sp.]|uniref:DoxX family protein n=1 Tax=Pseudorhodoplanes sp. TaxID=1934341 RepID=UPI003D10AF38